MPDVNSTVRLTQSKHFWLRMLGFIGPGFLIAVGFMDPGNWATDLAGGSRYGYALLFVIMVSNLLAMLLQSLALKLGIVTERDLAQACRERYRPLVAIALWISAEIAIAATDLAEIIGSAIALQLLFGLPLVIGVLLTGCDVLLILLLQNKGFRYLEALVITLVGTISAVFFIEVASSHPAWSHLLTSLVFPARTLATSSHMLYIAISILGATIMPHNLYLHSSIVQTRQYERTTAGKREAIRLAGIDSAVALLLALLVNAAILIVAAAVFHRTGRDEVAGIGDACKLLSPLLGFGAASFLFAVALLASGQNSTITGTLAGQIVMEGFLDIRLPSWLRRLITRSAAMLPTLVVAAAYGEKGTSHLLILSQVVLSMQLSFAVFPLVAFTSDRAIMGDFVNGPWLRRIAWAGATVIACLNIWLVLLTIRRGF